MRKLRDQVTKTKQRLNSKPTNVLNVYYKKGVFYGSFLDETVYNRVLVSHTNKFRTDYIKKMKDERRSDSYARTRNNIYRIVHSNVFKHGQYKPIFCTLTYSKNQTSLSSARREYAYFIKKLNIHLGYKCQYIVIPEIQQKRLDKYGVAVWHFHAVFFNLEYIPIKIFKSIWSFGSVDLAVARNIEDIGSYLIKYMTKQTNDSLLYGERAYNTSRGIIRPVHTFNDVLIDKFIENDNVIKVDEFISEDKKINKWKQK